MLHHRRRCRRGFYCRQQTRSTSSSTAWIILHHILLCVLIIQRGVYLWENSCLISFFLLNVFVFYLFFISCMGGKNTFCSRSRCLMVKTQTSFPLQGITLPVSLMVITSPGSSSFFLSPNPFSLMSASSIITLRKDQICLSEASFCLHLVFWFHPAFKSQKTGANAVASGASGTTGNQMMLLPRCPSTLLIILSTLKNTKIVIQCWTEQQNKHGVFFLVLADGQQKNE